MVAQNDDKSNSNDAITDLDFFVNFWAIHMYMEERCSIVKIVSVAVARQF